jgi:hypothetical protein
LGVGVPTHKVLLLGTIIFIEMNIFLSLMFMFLFMKFFFLGSTLVADLIVFSSWCWCSSSWSFSSWYDPCYQFNHLLLPNVGVLFYKALLLCLILVVNMIVFLFLTLVFLLMIFFSWFDPSSKLLFCLLWVKRVEPNYNMPSPSHFFSCKLSCVMLNCYCIFQIPTHTLKWICLEAYLKIVVKEITCIFYIYCKPIW